MDDPPPAFKLYPCYFIPGDLFGVFLSPYKTDNKIYYTPSSVQWIYH